MLTLATSEAIEAEQLSEGKPENIFSIKHTSVSPKLENKGLKLCLCTVMNEVQL